jgi:hypothetical protein
MQRRFGRARAGVVCALMIAGSMALAASACGPVRAADAGASTAILDKAIQALGGEEKLGKVKGASWKVKGTITFMGSDNPFTAQSVVQGLDHARREFEGDFGGNQVKGVTVLAGDKGWRNFGDNHSQLDKDALANEKRTAYLVLIPITILPLKGKEFKVEAVGEENAGGKPTVGIKATGPDGKDLTLYFDKESGVPVRMVAKVLDFMGNEFTQETTFGDYREMAGIKKATKVSSKRDGEKFIEEQVTEFKVLENVDPKSFAEPQ